MALISCPECGRTNVSDSAASCPDCGYGIRDYYKEKIQNEKHESLSEEENIKNASEDTSSALIKCPQCSEEISQDKVLCPNCGLVLKARTNTTNRSNNPKSKNKGCLIVVILVIIAFVIYSQISSDNYTKRETQAFKEQMEKDPSTWTQEEQNRFDDFWEYANEDSKNDND